MRKHPSWHCKEEKRREKNEREEFFRSISSQNNAVARVNAHATRIHTYNIDIIFMRDDVPEYVTRIYRHQYQDCGIYVYNLYVFRKIGNEDTIHINFTFYSCRVLVHLVIKKRRKEMKRKE